MLEVKNITIENLYHKPAIDADELFAKMME